MSRDPAATERWHSLSVVDTLTRLGSRESGLDDTESVTRRQRFGENSLFVSPPTPWWKILARQLSSLIVALLAVATIGAWLAGDRLEAVAILVVLVLNTGLGFTMEMWARQVMDSLRRLEVHRATVRRGGETRSIDSRGLVPGDIILVEAGEAVPADGRLLETTELRVVEASLTGESEPVRKAPEPVADAEEGGEVALADRTSMVFKGTFVATGSGAAVVVATGGDTQIGQIADLVLATRETRSPLERRLDILGRKLVWIALSIAALVAALGILRSREWWLMIETSIALAIAAIPEGLPVVATITLAIGMRRMARRQALVRRLAAVETLGSATVVCADKTGTLTACEMTAVAYRLCGRRIEVTGSGYRSDGEFLEGTEPIQPLGEPDLEVALRIGMLTNRAGIAYEGGRAVVRGDPTELALLVAGRKAGLDDEALRREFEEIGHIPFSSERMLMATFQKTPDGTAVAYVKGAPDRLLEMSASVLERGRVVAMTDELRREIGWANEELAGRGLRVLAFALRELDPGEELGASALSDLTYVGLVGIIDPPAPNVAQTVRALRGAGVRTVMITGDQAPTALAVGRQLGLVDSAEEVCEGTLLRRGSEETLDEALDRVGAFSRVSPVDKLRIVEAFQGRGEIVAMLGDGVNDAPALKRADIGVAMGGRGTDVAKETAALVLRDDRFETLVVAVREGRVIFDNIRKFVFYLFSCNLAEVLVLFIAGLAALPLPLLPLQILWLNLVTDVFPALALAGEPADPDVMSRPPRDPQAAILSRGFLSVTVLYAVLLTAATLASFLWALEVREVDSRRAVTIAFMTLALSQLFHVFNARAEVAVIFGRRLLANGWVWAALALTVGLQLLAVYQPELSGALRTTPLGAEDWELVLVASLVPLLCGQLWKAWRAPRRSRGGLRPPG